MKHLKTYENKQRLKKDFYVICSVLPNETYLDSIKKEYIKGKTVNTFLNNNVGKYIEYCPSVDMKYGIYYDNFPDNLRGITYEGLFWVEKSEIKEYGNNKEELELSISTKKYNL